MSEPAKIHRASSAADAVGHLIMPVREGKVSLSRALQSFFEMANTRSPLDLVRGIAMLRGWTYRPNPRSEPVRSEVAQNNKAVESVK